MSTHGIRCTITNNTNTYVVSTENTITPMPYFNVCLPFAFDSIQVNSKNEITKHNVY